MVEIRGGRALQQKLAMIAKAIGTQTKTLKVGFLKDALYPDGTYVALVAAIQNFGAPKAGIPPRPFFSNMVREKSPGWGKDMMAALRASDMQTDEALQIMGEHIAGQLRQSIQATNDPPLKPATIARKAKGGAKKVGGVYGPAKPLIDSGHLLESVDFEIKT